MNYTVEEENLRVIDAGFSKFCIKLIPGTTLWGVNTEKGQTPVALRDKRFTGHRQAAKAVQTYIDGHEERKVVYKNAK
jgi:hypothetical protein